MNNPWNKLKSSFLRKKDSKSFLISIVILLEVIAISFVVVHAWVETVSSIKIATESNGKLEVDTYVFTEATIGEGHGTIDLGKYFKQSGDMHFAPASSAYGDTLYFPKVTSAGTGYINSGTDCYRKSNISDMNNTYLSVTFKIKADTNADFFFKDEPEFKDEHDVTSNQANNIRVAVTAYTMGTPEGDLYDSSTGKPKYTKVYAKSASTAAVVNSTTGATAAPAVEAISSHIKGATSDNKLFSVGAEETKIVNIKVWLQGSSLDSNLPQNISISKFGIISDLTPRRVTLIPTPTWDLNNTTEYFYAWCWDSSKAGVPDRLYKLDPDENEHYSFDYNGTYRKTLFIRCGNANLQTSDMGGDWSTLGLWNKTENTTIPDSPVDPTYIIKAMSGNVEDDDITGNRSTGDWSDPVKINIAHVTGQDDTWGKMSATTYIDTSTSSGSIMEQTNSDSQKHATTVHGWTGKKLALSASLNENDTDHQFDGWYSDAAGTNRIQSSANTNFNISTAAGGEVTYYAKFKKVRTLTIVKYLDGNATTDATATGVGTITIGNNTSGADVASYAQTFDVGTTVNFSANASTGYTLEGIYSTAEGNNAVSSVTLDENHGNVTYYARFTTNLSTVKIYMAPRENWNEPDLHVWDSKGVIAEHLTATYDGSTGYYTAEVQTRGKWLKAIMSKDNNFTGQTGDITVVSSISPGVNYNKFINSLGTVSDWSSDQRCVWFIITEDWLKNNLKNDGDKMQIWNGTNDTDMRRINDYAYVCEYSSISNGTNIWIKQLKSDNTKRNEWATAITSGLSQYKETNSNSGEWQ